MAKIKEDEAEAIIRGQEIKEPWESDVDKPYKVYKTNKEVEAPQGTLPEGTLVFVDPRFRTPHGFYAYKDEDTGEWDIGGACPPPVVGDLVKEGEKYNKGKAREILKKFIDVKRGEKKLEEVL